MDSLLKEIQNSGSTVQLRRTETKETQVKDLLGASQSSSSADPRSGSTQIVDGVEMRYIRTPEGWRLLPVKDERTGQPVSKSMSAPHNCMHGFRGAKDWAPPRVIRECETLARPDQAEHSVPAHEYHDVPEVLEAKVQMLADMIRASKFMVLYTGAGISTASGIGDYATKSKESLDGRPKILSGFDAKPTFAHRVLAQLCNQGLVKRWVQQNHDGLPQKAGVPQAAMNEIHGAWYDPSNPVVKFSGNLRDDLFTDLLEWEDRTDLCLTVGTSLSGMNADRVAVTVARKSLGMKSQKRSYSPIGTVIINLQATQHDNLSALRIFARIDNVMEMLAQKLGLPHMEPDNSDFRNYVPDVPADQLAKDVFEIRYNSKGLKLEDESAPSRTLDLREDAKVVITSGPYKGSKGEVVGKNREGHYRIRFSVKTDKGVFNNGMILGTWFVEAAVKGTLECIPVVNAK